MAEVQKVRKRDGREVAFDPRKIAEAIHEAASAAGAGDLLVADELAAVVKLFLERDFAGRMPSVDDIHDLVERVLIGTGHAGAAKAYILNRQKRAERLDQLKVRSARPVAVSSVGVMTPVRQTSWCKQKIVEALLLEADLDATAADEVADAVEGRVLQSGLSRISVSLIRELVDIELFERGLNAPLARQQTIGIPRFDLERLVRTNADAPWSCEEASGRALLQRYALEALLPGPVAQAHLEGRVHVGDLEAPFRFLDLGLVIPAERVRDAGEAADAGAVIDELGVSARALTAHVQRDLIVLGGESLLALAPSCAEGLDGLLGRLLHALVDPGRASAPGRIVLALLREPASATPYHQAVRALLALVQRQSERAPLPRLRLALSPALLADDQLIESALQLEAMPARLELVRAPQADVLAQPLIGRIGVNLYRAAVAAGGWSRLQEELDLVLEIAAQAAETKVRWLERRWALASEAAAAFVAPAASLPRAAVVPVHLGAALAVLARSSHADPAGLAADLLGMLRDRFAAKALARGLAGELWREADPEAASRLAAIETELDPRAHELLAMPEPDLPSADPWQRLPNDASQSVSERIAVLRAPAMVGARSAS